MSASHLISILLRVEARLADLAGEGCVGSVVPLLHLGHHEVAPEVLLF